MRRQWKYDPLAPGQLRPETIPQTEQDKRRADIRGAMKVHREVVAQGFKGGYSVVRRFVE